MLLAPAPSVSATRAPHDPISVPADEMCFYLYEGPSGLAVGEASRRAQIPFERVVEALPFGMPGTAGSGSEVV